MDGRPRNAFPRRTICCRRRPSSSVSRRARTGSPIASPSTRHHYRSLPGTFAPSGPVICENQRVRTPLPASCGRHRVHRRDNRGEVDRPVALMSADHRLQVLRELPVTGREAKPRRVERVGDGVPGLCHLPGSPRAPGEPINLADHRIRRKQVLGGLTHEYYVAALPTCAATGKAGHHPNRISEPTDSGADHPS